MDTDAEPDRDDYKAVLVDKFKEEPDDTTSREYEVWLKKYNDLAAKLVRKFGKFDDSAHLLWMYEYRKEQSAARKALDGKWKTVQDKWIGN